MRLVDGFIRSGILSYPLSALALPFQISPCEASTVPVSQLFRLQQTDNIAVGVGEPGEFACGNGDRLHQRFAAERSGLVEVGLQVVYLYIDRDVIMRFVPERGDVAVDAFGASVDVGGGAGLRNVPVKKLAVKRLCFGCVTATDLEMHDRFSHFLFLLARLRTGLRCDGGNDGPGYRQRAR